MQATIDDDVLFDQVILSPSNDTGRLFSVARDAVDARRDACVMTRGDTESFDLTSSE